MCVYTLKAFAKINLSLDILRKREDGYHDVSMIMQSIELHDTITIKKSKNIDVFCSNQEIPQGEQNIAYKAAKELLDYANIQNGVEIIIQKNIPSAAGLAGGSTDAATVLKGMNKLYKLNYTNDKLAEIGLKIGADVPFCIYGGTMLAEGIGEKLTRLKSLEDLHLVLVKPNFSVSTPWAYSQVDMNKSLERPLMDAILNDIENNSVSGLVSRMKNVFEEIISEKHLEIKTIKNKFIEYGALGSMMSGSGPTVFGVFYDLEKAREASEKLKKDYDNVYLTMTVKGDGENV